MSNDNVNNPKHYQGINGLEVIEVMENFIPKLNGMKAVCMANIIKYILRHPEKNGVEDLMKARWYLDRLISYYTCKPCEEDEKQDDNEILLFELSCTDDVKIRDYISDLHSIRDERDQWIYIVRLMESHGKKPSCYYCEVKDFKILTHTGDRPSIAVYITLEDNCYEN